MHPRSPSRARRRIAALGGGVAALAAMSGCNPPPVARTDAAPSSPAAGSAVPVDGGAGGRARVSELLGAELRRRSDQVQPADLADRDVAVRRAAARALARIRAPGGRELLLRALSDEDEPVVAWAAYGLGEICAAEREPTVAALAAAWASLLARAGPAKPMASTGAAGLSAPRAIARAVAACGGPQAEPALVSWLEAGADATMAAVEGIGELITTMPRPREETFVALLELAAGNASAEPVPQALYPLGRAPHLPAQVQDRARDVAKARLAEPGPARIFAVRTLGRTGEAAIGTLREAVAQADRYTANERVEAIRMLARNGGAGQAALRELLASLLPSTQDPIAATALVSPNFGVLLTLLSSLTEVGKSRAQIERFASLPVPAQAPESVRRRISWLRCTAAQLLAERDYAHPTLLQCDQTTDKSIGARAQVAALGIEGARIRGKRLAAWRGHATGGDLRAREAALALIADHPEIEDVETVLAEALAAPHPGVVATAAEVIAKHPERVRSSAPPTAKKKPAVASSEVTAHARVASALLGALDARGATADLEVLAAVIDASGALLLDGTRSKLEQLCRSPHVTVREHAGKALALLLGGGEAARCETPAAGLPLPAELASPVVGPIRIQLETDAGALGLALDPTFAPVAVGRIVGLARAGFYDGMVVHRVVPGFVSQLGSPTADGYGGAAGKPAMPCETSPLGFGPAAVGIALAGRDTGSSQLFVTHAAHPHLDGRYPLIGTASGPWDALVDGDRVRKATVVP